MEFVEYIKWTVTHLGAWLLMLLCAAGMGNLFVRRCRFRTLTERMVFTIAAGLGFCALLLFLLGLIGVLYRPVIWILTLLGATAAILSFVHSNRRLVTCAWRERKLPPFNNGLVTWLAIFALCYWAMLLLATQYPPIQWDATMHHLPVARAFLSEHRLVPVGGHGVAVITRFDRLGKNRVPFISAATLLGLPRGDQGAYTLLADGIRQFGDNVPGDLRELWRRLVFSLLASNYDDHLRNHGFLMLEPGRWSLSPAYDINPVPEMDRVRTSKTAITEDQEESTIASTLAAAPRFGLKATESKKILREVFTAVSGWRKTGRQLRLKASTLDTYASAFEHPLLDEARRLLVRGRQ